MSEYSFAKPQKYNTIDREKEFKICMDSAYINDPFDISSPYSIKANEGFDIHEE